MKASGPLSAKIMLVGEAPGKQEELVGLPFIGTSGQELTCMLKEAGLDRSSIYLTNVFYERPPGNKLEEFCGSRADVGGGYHLPPLSSGKYVLPQYLGCLERLRAEIETVRPNIIIAAGGTASWALLQAPKITTVRGTVADCTLVPGVKVIPTFHPSMVLRAWQNRPVVLADLMKAKRESLSPELTRPERTIYYNPSVFDLPRIEQDLLAASILGTDIETKLGTITCIGFAPSPSVSYVIPFFDPRQKSGSYWPTPEQERAAWQMVDRVLSSPIPKVFQNGLYDLQYLLKMGLHPRACTEDTMILHHARFPEMQKSLGFLGSIYTNEASWKLLRRRGEASNKKEE